MIGTFRIALSLCFLGFAFPLYNGWMVYFVYQLAYFGRKRINLEHKETEENIYLRYRYKTEYYKYALMLAISAIEFSIFVTIGILKPLVFGLALNANSVDNVTFLTQNVVQLTISNTVNSLQNVTTLVALSLINILTIYMSYVCRSYTEFSPIKRKLRNTIILNLILTLLTLLTIIGILIVDLVTQILSVYEYIKLIKNSIQLYNLLKLRNEKLLTEDYNVYQKQKMLVRRYKWFTIFNLVALFGFTCATLLITLYYIIFTTLLLLGFDSYEKLKTIINSSTYIDTDSWICLIDLIISISSFAIFSFNIIWITLVHVAENINYSISGSWRKRQKRTDLTERLLF